MLLFKIFLLETLTITNSHNDNAQVGFVIGNYYSYGNETNEMLQRKIKDLEQIIELMKNNKTDN